MSRYFHRVKPVREALAHLICTLIGEQQVKEYDFTIYYLKRINKSIVVSNRKITETT